jgi:hypothetical protein
MNGFSFQTTAGTSQSTTKPRLAGNDIYDVKFDGCEIVDIQGVKDASMTYKVLKLKFSNDDGSFEHTVFEPQEKDFSRTETEYKDAKTGELKKIPQPSGVENIMLLFKHAIDAINPTIAKAIDNKTQNLGAKDWDGLRKLVAQILDAGKETTTQIKLLKNGKGEASFPGYFASINKDSAAYIKNNFIGGKLAFSAYEQTRINNASNAKPTTAASYDNFAAPKADTEPNGLDLDFEMPLL